MTRTLAKQDGFLPAMKGCQMENSRTQPPPFHIASLLSPSPPSSDREKKASGDVSATVHYLPAEGSRDVNALSGSAELPTSCVYTGEFFSDLAPFFERVSLCFAVKAPLLQDTVV